MRIHCIALATVASAALIAGCGGQEVSSPYEYDVATLNSGNYPTQPRDISTMNLDKSGQLQEAARLGAVLPIAADIDAIFSYRTGAYIDRRVTPTRFPTGMIAPNTPEAFATLAPGFVAGWQSHGTRRMGGVGRTLEMQTFRFESPDQARAAAPRFADVLDREAPGEQATIPEHPQARATWSPTGKSLDSLLVHDIYLLRVRVEEPVNDPPQMSALLELTQKALVKMVEGLRNFSPTPVDQLASLPGDTEGMLARTLPMEESNAGDGPDPSMVLTRQAWLHSDNYPLLSKAAYADAGVDLVSVSGTTLIRTRDTPSAERLVAALIARAPEKYRTIDSPPNMPGVRCFERKDLNAMDVVSYPTHCYLISDRYVAYISGSNTQQVHQVTAAQYKILEWGS